MVENIEGIFIIEELENCRSLLKSKKKTEVSTG
jgi:hypothetical protein